MDKAMMRMMHGSASRRSINNKRKKSVTLGRSTNNLIPGFDAQVPEKSKKVRSLSAVSKSLSRHQMGCHLDENAISNNKFKLPETHGVNHASVPRKIRSAMKKRGRESILTDSEKVNREVHGIESPEKNGIKKKSKKKRSTATTGQVVSGPITKDEEEVAETLYALAGMFPTRTEIDCETLPENSSVLQDHQQCANATFQASGTTKDASLFLERPPAGDAKISSLNETSGQEQTDRTAPDTNMQAVSMMVRSENGGEVPSNESELCLEMGLNVTAQLQNSYPDVEFQTARGIGCKQEHHIIKRYKENGEGPALWPDLSSRLSARMDSSELQSSAVKTPNWLNAAICASKQEVMQSFSPDKLKMQVSEAVTHRKSWKKCAAHVHISHFIRSSEVAKRQVAKEPERVDQGSKCGVLMETHNLNWMSNGSSSATENVHSTTVRSSYENGIPQQQSHYHDTFQTLPLTPGVYSPQKQSFNFLSLSVGSNGLKVKDSFNEGGSRLELLSKSQVPYFQSLQQQHGLMPFPTPQSQHASTSYLDQLPAAGPQVRLQQPHYYGTPLCGTQYSSTASYKQQQQSFWAVQLAANGGSAVNCNIMRAQYPNWQSGRVESCAVSPFAQVILPRSAVSLGSKITSISQQKPFALASSLHTSRTLGLDIHLPSACEESKGRFHSSGGPSLQLLCDERV